MTKKRLLQICTLWPAIVPNIPTAFETVPQVAIATISATRHRLWWLGMCSLLARRYTHTVYLRRDAKKGGT
jgi:hypothetical protein